MSMTSATWNEDGKIYGNKQATSDFEPSTSWRRFENHLSSKPWFCIDKLAVVNRHMPSRVTTSRDSDARG